MNESDLIYNAAKAFQSSSLYSCDLYAIKMNKDNKYYIIKNRHFGVTGYVTEESFISFLLSDKVKEPIVLNEKYIKNIS